MVTQTDKENLEKAIATGNLTVEYEGRKVTKRSIQELKEALDYVNGQLAAQSGAAARQSFVSFTKD